MHTKISHRNYYDHLPEPDHRPGDIWHGLPSHGLLKWPRLSGIVVTPACDLQNRKVDTVTYLPILPIRKWVSSFGFMGELRIELNSILEKLERIPGFPKLPRLGRNTELREVLDLQSRLEAAAPLSSDSGLTSRVTLGLRLAATILGGSDGSEHTKVGEIFGTKRWLELRQRIVTNSLRTDLHFLPRDGLDEDWSGVPAHSVVLFRFPLSAPLALFDLATDGAIVDWQSGLNSIRGMCPGIGAFSTERPTKRTRVQDRFLADLLTRYVSLYSRLGSPDFSDETVLSFCHEIEGDL